MYNCWLTQMTFRCIALRVLFHLVWYYCRAPWQTKLDSLKALSNDTVLTTYLHISGAWMLPGAVTIGKMHTSPWRRHRKVTTRTMTERFVTRHRCYMTDNMSSSISHCRRTMLQSDSRRSRTGHWLPKQMGLYEYSKYHQGPYQLMRTD